jgi:MOSC domain-containing protein YiiM
MHLVSVNVSAGTIIEWQGRRVLTGIFKQPVAERVHVRRSGLDGDRQGDRTVHGGQLKAVYSYSVANYEWWNRELGRVLPPGMFGENLTIVGLDEEAIAVGDRFSVGTAILEAVQPRLPCYKLGLRFGDQRMVKRFRHSGRFGTYFRVVTEGDVGAGDEVHLVHHDPASVLIASLVNLRSES